MEKVVANAPLAVNQQNFHEYPCACILIWIFMNGGQLREMSSRIFEVPFWPCCVNSACDWSLQVRHWRVLTNQTSEYPRLPRPRSATEFRLLIGQNPGDLMQCLACIDWSQFLLAVEVTDPSSIATGITYSLSSC